MPRIVSTIKCAAKWKRLGVPTLAYQCSIMNKVAVKRVFPKYFGSPRQ
jgi:hypothetical protein